MALPPPECLCTQLASGDSRLTTMRCNAKCQPRLEGTPRRSKWCAPAQRYSGTPQRISLGTLGEGDTLTRPNGVSTARPPSGRESKGKRLAMEVGRCPAGKRRGARSHRRRSDKRARGDPPACARYRDKNSGTTGRDARLHTPKEPERYRSSCDVLHTRSHTRP